MLRRVADRGWWLGVGVATFGFAMIAVIAALLRPEAPLQRSACGYLPIIEPTAVRDTAVAHETVPPAPPPAALLRAVIDTGAGPINCTLDAVDAPHTVALFARLARAGFYDGDVFYRTIADVFIQAGDRGYTSTGAPRLELAHEFTDALTFDRPGMLALPNNGDAADANQFFITDAALPQLNGKATIFGHCDHPELVHRIASIPTVGGDYPDFPVKIAVEVSAIR